MTGVEGLGLTVSVSFAQPLQSTFRASALTSSSAGSRADRGNDDAGGGAVSATISAAGQLLGNLHHLLNQDPTQFQQVLTQIAGQLQGAAQPVGPNGPTKAPAASGVSGAATGSAGATPATDPSSPSASSPGPAPSFVPVSTPASSTSAVTATTTSSAAAGSSGSTTTATPAQGQSELSQLMS